MHFAAEMGYVDIVSMLFSSGAQMTRSAHGMTPLLAAAERCQQSVVNVICERHEVSKRDKIDAFELLGASYANDKDSYDLQKCYT